MKLGPEYYESVLLADWLTRHKILFTHFPAGEVRDHREVIRKGRRIRYSPAGAKLRRMGLLPGVSDYIIFDNSSGRQDGQFTFIELKAKQQDGGRRPTPEQIAFREAMRTRGHRAEWFYGADAAIAWLESLGFGK